ncbi:MULTISPECIES: hypothetical protein [unclassified Streptomyces]|uniref:hypothetical protein n=1 Tax=unclassified Streptomyces TaxID=2593676 RepID=UPI0036B6A898
MTVRISAAVPVPDQQAQYWILSGDQYVRIHIADGEPHQDTVVSGPGSIAKDWPSLAGFDHVDAVVPVPDQPSQYWILSGDQYVRIHIADGEPHQDTVVSGPGSIAKDWPSLSGLR